MFEQICCLSLVGMFGLGFTQEFAVCWLPPCRQGMGVPAKTPQIRSSGLRLKE